MGEEITFSSIVPRLLEVSGVQWYWTRAEQRRALTTLNKATMLGAACRRQSKAEERRVTPAGESTRSLVRA